LDWINDINKAILYIENNLESKVSINDISNHIYSSTYNFQRVFSILTGLSVGEYIKNRRLSLAGTDLCKSNTSVLDVALKYGYETSESFSKAFTRFHGIPPKNAKKKGNSLKFYGQLKIVITLEGGNFMEYRIEKKPKFKILAMTESFNGETSTIEIPKFWGNFFAKGYGSVVSGWYGVCHDMNGDTFKYSIADPYEEGTPVPENFNVISIPELTWAIFTCIGPMPDAIQNTWKKIFTEWLPSSEYEVVPGFDFEYYSGPNTQDPDYLSEIWISVKKK
jgi:AraC family transcriptional regulator